MLLARFEVAERPRRIAVQQSIDLCQTKSSLELTSPYLAPKGPPRRTMLMGVMFLSQRYAAQEGTLRRGRCGSGCSTSGVGAASDAAAAGSTCILAFSSDASFSMTCCGEPCSVDFCGPTISGGCGATPAKKGNLDARRSCFFLRSICKYLATPEPVFRRVWGISRHSTSQSSRPSNDP